jgi:hypothetical protein
VISSSTSIAIHLTELKFCVFVLRQGMEMSEVMQILEKIATAVEPTEVML